MASDSSLAVNFDPDLKAGGPVVHPKHYNDHPSGVECITIVESMGFNIGNVVKYCWRAGLKPDAANLVDLKKARFYLDREISRLQTSK